MDKVLYHYTDAEGLRGILKTKTILPSLKADNPKDARYGNGQYLSDIVPRTKRPGQLSRIFLNMPWAGKKFTHYVEIDIRGLDIVPGRPHVFLIVNDKPLDISKRLVSHGPNVSGAK